MQFTSPQAEHRYAELIAAASHAVVGLDFDGVLSPIVPDPDQARIHPAGPATLIGLAQVVRQVAVVTGRPARQAVTLGDLDEVGDAIAATGRELLVLGQYGNERWSSADRRVTSPQPPPGLASLMRELPALLAEHGLAGAHLEEKGLAVAVHTRRMPDPGGAASLLEPVLADSAARHGLVTEPGRYVVEVRAPGMDKGQAVRRLQREYQAEAFMFIGDDLGDVPAFQAVINLRSQGMPGLLVCSASDEQPALTDLADVIVDGPDGVMALLRRLTGEAG
ncbi:MAG: trehalose-phosphatase [Nocardioidaceae bacterium]|nr:MAG: trehalose-phosphatase [Nocardioidaceae bacterium]